jgi:hypothetical protein
VSLETTRRARTLKEVGDLTLTALQAHPMEVKALFRSFLRLAQAQHWSDQELAWGLQTVWLSGLPEAVPALRQARRLALKPAWVTVLAEEMGLYAPRRPQSVFQDVLLETVLRARTIPLALPKAHQGLKRVSFADLETMSRQLKARSGTPPRDALLHGWATHLARVEPVVGASLVARFHTAVPVGWSGTARAAWARAIGAQLPSTWATLIPLLESQGPERPSPPAAGVPVSSPRSGPASP